MIKGKDAKFAAFLQKQKELNESDAALTLSVEFLIKQLKKFPKGARIKAKMGESCLTVDIATIDDCYVSRD